MSGLVVHEAVDKRDRLLFVRFPWSVYRENPYWVPPLVRECLAKISSAHPFYAHADAAFFIARQEGRIVGRIAAIIDQNYIRIHNSKTGFFGFFEAFSEPRIASALLETARCWLKERGMESMIGPMSPSTNDECGLLLDGFDTSPCFMMPYNPPYYASMLENFGLCKARDLYAYRIEQSLFDFRKVEILARHLQKKKPALTARPVAMASFGEDLQTVKEIYNQAWSENWGFVPITDAEIDLLANRLKPLIVPGLCLFAHWGEKPVGFSLTLPDYNIALKRLNGRAGLLGKIRFYFLARNIRSCRVMLLGVTRTFRRRGVEAMLLLETVRHALSLGYNCAECSWILEDNELIRRTIESLGGQRYKTYRIYSMDI
ncbi:MAG: N-acetyltransferase [Deltaproteobacteria bacterium]|nr:N-acetyltransferase [Deltaproteobacteria bacterium]